MKNYLDIFLRVKADKAKKDLKDVDKGLGGLGKATKVAGKGFSLMGAAIKGMGIGLLLAPIMLLFDAFRSNQKLMDSLNTIMIALSKAFQVIADVVAVLVDGLMGLVGWLFGAGDASDSFASSLVEQRKQVKLLEAELGLLQLQYLREAELLRQIRDDEALSIEERIQANFELGKVLAEQSAAERDIAFQSLKLAEMELTVNKDNVDLQVEVTNAKIKLAEIDERITGQRSEQLVNLNSLEREKQAQNKEAAAKREEQLKAEQEMLQELIDLQNEDIRVKKEQIKTINTQLDNATKQNETQIAELKKREKAELAALLASKNTAKENIKNQEANVKGYEEEIGNIEEQNKKKIEETEKTIKRELELFRMKTETQDHISFQVEEQLEKLNKRKITSLDELNKYSEDYNKILADGFEKSADDNFMYIGNAKELIKESILRDGALLVQTIGDVNRQLQEENQTTTDLTLEQIEVANQSAESSVATIDNYAQKKLEIEQKYATKIEETEKSLVDTRTTLREQAADELFLHFETEQEKEIRLVEEKYSKLIGLAQENWEQTIMLKQQEQAELEEINTRADRKLISDSLTFYKKMREQRKKDSDLEKKKVKADKEMKIDAAQQTFAMGVGLAKEGTATYKALASAETIMATYTGASKALADVPAPWSFIQAGLIIAAGAKNLAEISKTKVEGASDLQGRIDDKMGSGSEFSGDMGGGVPGITFGDAGSDFPPVQAYVVETDISNAQALQSELDLQSTL